MLLAANLAVATYDPKHLSLFSPASQAQLALSRDAAKLIEDEGTGCVRTALTVFITRDPQWVERSKRALAEIRSAESSEIRPEATAARQASIWQLLADPGHRGPVAAGCGWSRTQGSGQRPVPDAEPASYSIASGSSEIQRWLFARPAHLAPAGPAQVARAQVRTDAERATVMSR